MTHLLGPAFKGAVDTYATVIIDAPVERVWKILLDLPKYPEWNPFLRSKVMVDPKTRQPLADQTFTQGGLVQLQMQVPPGMDASAKRTTTHEDISLVDHAEHRITWGGKLHPALFRAEQCQALSATADGKTRYEVKQAVGGVLAYPMNWSMGANFQKAFDAMAEALKRRAEDPAVTVA